MKKALIISPNSALKECLKKHLEGYAAAPPEDRNWDFLLVDLTNRLARGGESWREAKSKTADYLFEIFKKHSVESSMKDWRSVLVMLPCRESFAASAAVAAAEGFVKSVACEVAEQNTIVNVLKISGGGSEKAARLAAFFADRRAYMTAQVLTADVSSLSPCVNSNDVRRVALVTGCGRGIGFATAKELSRLGFDVCTNDICFDTEFENEADRYGWYKCFGDISEKEITDRLISDISERFGRLDVIVANAAYMKMTPFSELKKAEFDKHFSVNVEGHINLIEKSAEIMRQNRGSIILLSSMFGVKGWKNACAYAATKRAAVGLCSSLAKEPALSGVSVCAIAPGFIDTPQLKADADDMGVTREEMIKIYEKNIPLGRVGTAEDAAYLVGFLASEAGGAFSGSVIQTNGGESR